MRFIVVDDESLIRDYLWKLLVAKGHSVALAVHGEEAMKYMEQLVFDFAIVDLIMPQVEGLELILHIKEFRPNMKIIAISGGMANGLVDFLDVAKRFGAHAVLHKPFNPQQIYELIEILADNPGLD